MEEKILRLLTSVLDERIKQVTESLADGAVKDFAEYRYMCGTIRGLSFAHAEVQDLVRRLREIDDE